MVKVKKVIYIIFIINLMLLCGCIKINDLHQIAIVTSFAIDLDGEDVLITCEIINPTGGGGGGGSSQGTMSSVSQGIAYIQGKGKTPLEAIRDVSLHFDRRLFFSHANTLIFGEEIARTGIIPYLDLFIRDEQGRENIYLLVAKDAKGYEMLGIRGELNNSSGSYLNDILENFKFNSRNVITTIVQFSKYYYDITGEPVVGVVSRRQERVIDLDKAKENPTKINVEVTGGAVFRKDKLIGYFDEEEVLGFNFIVNEVKGGIIVFETKEKLSKSPIIGNEKMLTTVEILRSKTKLEVDIIDDNIHLYINIDPAVGLPEDLKAVDLSNKEVIKKLEESCNEEIKSFVTKAMEKAQKEFKQDNFGIGKSVHIKYPELWEEISSEWNEIFSNITYEVNVDTNILKVGMMNVPSNLRKGR